MRIIKVCSLLGAVLLLTQCASITKNYEASCKSELDDAWKELSISEAKGFKGTWSYTKAVSYITTAKATQAAGKYESCYNEAKQARAYIKDSYKGK